MNFLLGIVAIIFFAVIMTFMYFEDISSTIVSVVFSVVYLTLVIIINCVYFRSIGHYKHSTQFFALINIAAFILPLIIFIIIVLVR